MPGGRVGCKCRGMVSIANGNAPRDDNAGGSQNAPASTKAKRAGGGGGGGVGLVCGAGVGVNIEYLWRTQKEVNPRNSLRSKLVLVYPDKCITNAPRITSVRDFVWSAPCIIEHLPVTGDIPPKNWDPVVHGCRYHFMLTSLRLLSNLSRNVT